MSVRVIRVMAVGLLLLSPPVRSQAGEPPPQEEQAAERALERARGLVERGKMRAAWELLQRLRGPLRETRAASAAKEEIARLRLVAGLEVVGAAAGFAAAVEPLPGGRLRVTYDFARDAASCTDFEEVPTLPDTRRLTRRRDVVRGTGAWCHRAPFTGDVLVRVRGVPLADHDFGLVVVDPGADESRFLVGVANNAFFGVRYGRDRRTGEGHLLLFCGRGAESRSGRHPTELLAQRVKDAVKRGADVELSLSWRGESVTFGVDAASLDARAAPPAKRIDRRRVGLHLHRSAFRVARAVIEGRLDPEWAREETDRLRTLVR